MSGPRRELRKRIYGLVTLAIVCVVGLIAMGSLLTRGKIALDKKVYRYPHKTLLHLAKAERRFWRESSPRRYARSLAELEASELITARLGSGELGDYRYQVVKATEREWAITATPAQVTSSTLFYYADETWIVRSRRGAPAGASSDVYWSPYQSGTR